MPRRSFAEDGRGVRALASYASNPARSRGRLHEEQNSTARGPRDAFQRDRDRIIHSISFRRLRHKTQVFMAPDGSVLGRVRGMMEPDEMMKIVLPASAKLAPGPTASVTVD